MEVGRLSGTTDLLSFIWEFLILLSSLTEAQLSDTYTHTYHTAHPESVELTVVMSHVIHASQLILWLLRVSGLWFIKHSIFGKDTFI